MSQLLWQKTGVKTDPSVMRFLAGNDIVLDRVLFSYDMKATKAHAHGLGIAGLLEQQQVEQLVGALSRLEDLWECNKFDLDDRFEDGHSAIESFLTEQLGELGGRVHLGRSRNDQVLVATRLYMIDSIDNLSANVRACGHAALIRAREHEFDPMPGYTHLQRAVPSTVGLWMSSFAESFSDSLELLMYTRQWIDACPLGTAAGYGINLPLARKEVSQMLGFSRLMINPMAAQASRGKHELQVLSAMWQVMQDIRRLAWDLSLYSSAEFSFVRMPNDTTTGSSIMPNKKNPDLVELLRASSAIVAGAMSELQHIISLPSGYHRDLQLTKAPLIRAIQVTLEATALVADVILRTEFDLAKMKAAIDPAMMATDRAVDLTSQGVSFRQAYQTVADEIADLSDDSTAANAMKSIQARISMGGCANLCLDEIQSRLDKQIMPSSAVQPV